ncbi:M15 family metallopeptidase [Vagococcus zengguangii]|uniref:D-alanyl-D-alanine carboxypeptidase family protein n=1 Tax=Vagococcus zengguangii TaxID=2571750 RepID=A0A4D7CY75_9ENTE|nr:M15 family metallopeptidase [Vagococcus zengguangii]QCI86840.1 D-alanyl-D-alanine carboxypeptidase family protein [Vagococcus zengguangii]TLG80446.1 D-alanyl-D-alanine carboxypeptidase family protein [Vagococcus zengguangii]
MSKKILVSLALLMAVMLIINRKEAMSQEHDNKTVSVKQEQTKEVSNNKGASNQSIDTTSDNEQTTSTDKKFLEQVDLSRYDLILVNDSHAFSDEQLPAVTGIIDSNYQVHADLVTPYQKMKEAAAADGISLRVVSTYRSVSYQEQVYEQSISDNINAGMSQQEAEEETAVYVAEPGKSEHHTGLAIDLVDQLWLDAGKGLVPEFIETAAGKWIDEHCAEFGFIIRFPKGKEEITNINYEPWHIRYVGVENAKYITGNQLTLEEFVELVEKIQKEKN